MQTGMLMVANSILGKLKIFLLEVISGSGDQKCFSICYSLIKRVRARCAQI